MSGTVRNTRGNIPYCSAECARTVETDTKSSLYKEDWKILLLRFVMSTLLLIMMVSLFSGIMVWKNCTFPFAAYVAGTVISAMALGSLGFAVSILSNSAIAGYLASAGYFLLNFLPFLKM